MGDCSINKILNSGDYVIEVKPLKSLRLVEYEI